MQDVSLPSITLRRLEANALGITSNVPTTVVGPMFLNPGIWQLTGGVTFIGGASVVITSILMGFSTITNAVASIDGGVTSLFYTPGALDSFSSDSLSAIPIIVSVPSNGINYYLTVRSSFTDDVVTVCGIFNAIQISP